MALSDNIKKIREDKGLMQKDVAAHIAVDKSTYSKIEKGSREVTVVELQKIAALFNTSIDRVVNLDGGLPEEVVLEDKDNAEQMRLIQQLDEDDRATVLKVIDKMLTTKRFREFFQKNVAML